MCMSQTFLLFVGISTLFVALERPSSAQWNGGELKASQRYSRWNKDTLPKFPPEFKIGASSLAFDPDEFSLYTACEKFPFLLRFPLQGDPKRIELKGIYDEEKKSDAVDIEGLSIHDGRIYMVDEDRLVVYYTPLDKPGAVTTLKLTGGVFSDEDGRKKVRQHLVSDESNHSSLEGIVVYSQKLGPDSLFTTLGSGPYFYLLDECDVDGNERHATLYVGGRVKDQKEIRISPHSISFPLGENFRLPELFRHGQSLFALMTQYDIEKGVGTDYQIVQLDLSNGTLSQVCSFKKTALATLEDKKWNNNYEGAVVNADGQLVLIADNENIRERTTETPQKGGKGSTPLVFLKPVE